MAGKNSRHVVPGKGGGWDVKRSGTTAAKSHHKTQANAEKAAKADLRKAGGGEAVIHRPDGSIRDRDTVPPAKDPFPPRDRKH